MLKKHKTFFTHKKMLPTGGEIKPLVPIPQAGGAAALQYKREERPFAQKETGRTGQEPSLKIIPLGGCGEIGKNMMAYEYGDDIVVVDCGNMFPKEEMLGIDLVIADTRYLEENKKKIRAFVITHGHEDHIGGLAYIWPKFPVPIFASDLTAGMIKVKLQEFNLTDPDVHVAKSGDKIQLGVFQFEFFQLTHSIPGALGLAIHTPEGLVIHVTDWKIDHTPVGPQRMDYGKLAQFGDKGVLCLLSDSTNVEVPGYTISEKVVGETFDNIFKNAKGRIIVTSFASQINRIQQVINAAVRYRRKVAVSGRSMENNINVAMKLGFLKIPEGVMADIRNINRLPDHEVAVLCTGSQGEEYSALVRMASGEHRHIKIQPGDTVVISASPVPGNEASISDTINNLFREGATVVYGKSVDIHVSGHANQEEMKMLLALARPKYFIPIHGEFRFLVLHAKLAAEMGVEPKNTIVAEDGDIVEFKNQMAKLYQKRVPHGYVLVDGLGIGDVGNIVLRDRQAMAKDGIFVVILTVDKSTGKIVTSPDIISRGFVYMRAAEDLIFKARQEVKNMFTRHNQKYPMNWEFIKRALRDEMSEFLYNQTQRRPMVIPVIIEI